MKAKVKEEIAILIEKKIVKADNTNQVRKIMRMRFGIYDDLSNNNKKKIEHYLIFMTRKGPKQFLVDQQVYSKFEINSMGSLVREKNKFSNFLFNKIATSGDVERLGW